MKDMANIKDLRTRTIVLNIEKEMHDIFKDKLRSIILYGSFARNENVTESDMDIMILVDEKEDILKNYEDQITDIMVDMSLEYELVLSLYTQSVQEYEKQEKYLPFIKNIQNEGIKIYG